MKSQSSHLTILFFTMVVVMLGFGIIIPLLPFYIESFGAGGMALGALMSIYGVLQFIFAPIWGSLSDRYGRKRILMIGILGNALSQLLFGLSSALWMLFAARALAGILSSATLPTAQAFIGDTTSEKDRSKGMGIIGAAMGVGMILGPGLGGLLARGSLATPFFVASALSMLALLGVALFLPEPERQIVSTPPAAAAQPRLQAMARALRGPLAVLFAMAFLLTFGLTNFEAVFGLYAEHLLDYTPGQVGLTLSVIGLISALMQGVVTGPATRRLGEVRIIRLALLGSGLGFLLMLLPRSTPGVLLTTGFFAFSNAMLNPSVSALISQRTRDGQGVTLGLSNSFQSLGRVFGPLWAGSIFDLRYYAPYLSGALIMLLGLGVALGWLRESAPAESLAPEIIKTG